MSDESYNHNFNRIKQHLNAIISHSCEEFKTVAEANYYRAMARESAQSALCYIPAIEVNNLGNDREGNKVQQIHDPATEGHKSS